MKILFLAEAASGKDRHFYAANTILFKTMKTAFEQQFGSFAGDQEFLQFFSSSGCYLDHLCLSPVPKSPSALRKEVCRKCVGSLAARLVSYQPAMIIVVMKSILKEVKDAMQEAGTDSTTMIRTASFPSMSEKNRLNCITAIRAALQEAVEAGIMHDALFK